jgi:hypothetical protein
MGPAFLKSIKANAPNASQCIDPFYADLRVMPSWLSLCLVGVVSAARRSA